MKYNNFEIQTLEDKDLILLIEDKNRGGESSVMGDIYVKSDKRQKITFVDVNYLFGLAMSESLPYDEIKFDNIVK